MKRETESIGQIFSSFHEGKSESLWLELQIIGWRTHHCGIEAPPVYESPAQGLSPRTSKPPDAVDSQHITSRPTLRSEHRLMETTVPAGREDHMSSLKAVPLNLLKRHAAIVECPRCRSCERSTTFLCAGTRTQWVYPSPRISPQKAENTNGLTQESGIATLLFFTTVVFACVPYLTSSTKDVKHHCSNCGTLLARWKRSHTSVYCFKY